MLHDAIDSPGEPLAPALSSSPSHPSLGCTLCEIPIVEAYYRVNGLPACAACRAKLLDSTSVVVTPGRLIGAALRGGLAGAVGLSIYFGIVAVADVRLVFLTILIAILAGGGVRKGSGNAGGRPYQIMAVVLTLLLSQPLVLCVRNRFEAIFFGIALFSAWRINAARRIHVTGPFAPADAGVV